MPRFALKYPFFIIMLCLVVAVVGLTTVARMPVDLFPQIKIPVVVVATFYAGMPPEQIEADITDTFERFFTLGSNIDHIESRSLTGVSLIKIYFKPGSDANAALSNIANLAMADLRRLPPGTLPPVVLKFDASSLPVCLVTLKGEGLDETRLKDLAQFRPELVIARGKTAARDGKLLIDLPAAEYPSWSKDTMHLARALTAGDFRLDAQRFGTEAAAHVIGVKENQAPTEHLVMKVPVESGEVRADVRRDIAKLAHLDRHHGSGRVQVGFVHGFGFTEKCAIATTVAHDCHNLLVVGTDDGQMAAAANELAGCGGGQVVVRDGKVLGKAALPVAGLMSDRPASEVAVAAAGVLRGFRECGCALHNPNMQLSLLGLVVIPELRLSDKGLVDVNRFTVIRVLE